jgi:hypothetical protein
MHNSLKKRLFEHLYSILVISCTFGLVQKKPTFLLFLCGFLLILQEKFLFRSLTKMNEFFFFVYKLQLINK